MEYCPECGNYTLELAQSESALKCYFAGCGYSEPVDVNRYLQIHNDLPNLARPPHSIEIVQAIDNLSGAGGTFQRAKELNLSLREDVRKTLEYRRNMHEREIYDIERILKILKGK